MANRTITGTAEDVQPVGGRGWLVTVRDPSYLDGFAVSFFVAASELPPGIDEPRPGDVVEGLAPQMRRLRRVEGAVNPGGLTRRARG